LGSRSGGGEVVRLLRAPKQMLKRLIRRAVQTSIGMRIVHGLLRGSNLDVVLMYHSVSSARNDYRYAVDRATFTEHLDYLSKEFNIVPLKDIVEHSSTKSGFRVAITFDDALEDFYTNAWPDMESRGVPSTVFVPTDLVGTTDSTGQNRGYMGWPQISELSNEKLINWESHSAAHHHLRSMTEEEIIDDLNRSIESIQSHIGHPPAYFAYPGGKYSPQSNELALESGFEALFTSDNGFVESRKIVNRVTVTANMVTAQDLFIAISALYFRRIIRKV
jgi:peptidoglycan/xylan/chitin deacetylase (PgdA/CDA1 family)